MPALLLVGSNQVGSLESSYARAFAQLGWEVHFWDPSLALYRHVRGGQLGRLLSSFLQVEPWNKKANRDLAVKAYNLKPNLILTFTHPVLRAGTLAQIKASMDVMLINVWPDTLVNWETSTSTCAGLYDLVAAYSKRSVPLIARMGAHKVVWIPLAGDPTLHPATVEAQRPAEGPELSGRLERGSPALPGDRRLEADITFIGGWRPERESLLSELGAFKLKIWGPDWGRRARPNSVVRRAWQGRSLRGSEFAQAVTSSKVNLNLIDPTNYPAANMRFFEIPVAGGLQVSSPCPEMEGEFEHERHLFYFRSARDLPQMIRTLLPDDSQRARVAAAAHDLVMAKHTYVHRARAILTHLPAFPPPRPG